jgi:hypothetical protein
MGSGTYGPSGLDSSSSLELALDQAIARRFSSGQERAAKKRRHSPTPMLAALHSSASQATAEKAAEQTAPLGSPREATAEKAEQTAPLGSPQTALTVTSKQTALAIIPSRLSWRGIEVTDEFQLYAARVALGEELAPYRGAVLSRPCSDFPWGSPTSTTVPTPKLPRYPERGRSLRTVLWVGGAVASIIGALGVGAGATSTSTTDNGVDAYDPVQGTAALTPTPASARGDSPVGLQGGALDDALETSLAAELPPLSARGGEPPIATAAPQRPAFARSPDVARSPEAPRPVPAVARVNGTGVGAARANAPGEGVSRLTIPSAGPLQGAPASTRSAAAALSPAARPSSPTSDGLPADDSTLFSDSPSF